MPWVKLDVKLRERLADIKGNDLKIWLSLALHVNPEGISWPSLSTIVQETGLKKPNISRSLRSLSNKGFVQLIHQGGKGPHSVSIWKVMFCSYGNSLNNHVEAVPATPQPEVAAGTDETWDPMARTWKAAKGGEKGKVKVGYWETNTFLDLVALKEGVQLINYGMLLGRIRPVFEKTKASVTDMCDCYNRMKQEPYWGKVAPADVVVGICKWFPTYLKLKAEGKLGEFLKSTADFQRKGGRGVQRLPTAYTAPPGSGKPADDPDSLSSQPRLSEL